MAKLFETCVLTGNEDGTIDIELTPAGAQPSTAQDAVQNTETKKATADTLDEAVQAIKGLTQGQAGQDSSVGNFNEFMSGPSRKKPAPTPMSNESESVIP